jgi:hypothetical protein
MRAVRRHNSTKCGAWPGDALKTRRIRRRKYTAWRNTSSDCAARSTDVRVDKKLRGDDP